ncbi:unnamed protein product [Parnassius mnemosyne]|uniref:Reverse transcriptase Ty1/copia-type domain-containing protein n=1 Tax=Parnassius mnemosyne TaxID=213953 RepID=A0AAV1KEY1_9NEOP
MKIKGFQRAESDYCLYFKDGIYILLYVDDLLVLGEDNSRINNVKEILSTEFKMKDLGSKNLKYLGINIIQDSDCFYINHKEYLKSILTKFGMSDANASESPMEVNVNLDDCTVDYSLEHKCRACIGSLMYAVVGSRPDLCAAVSYLARYQSRPSERLWQCLKRILRYIKGTINYNLKYNKNCNSEPLVGYADASFAVDKDRKSITGYVFKVFNNSVIWRCKKQSTVALSTTEAELYSLNEAALEACWIRKLLNELDVSCNTTTIYEDNKSTIFSVCNPDQKRMKRGHKIQLY